VNGDAIPDLVCANKAAAGTVSVALGLGGGAFGAATSFLVGSMPAAVALADLDANGTLDLVTANDNNGGTLSLRLGNGAGGFGAVSTLTGHINPRSVALADVNNDGKHDILSAESGSNQVYVRLGTGGGAFGAPTGYATLFNPAALAVGDLDSDDRLDVVAANHTATGSLSLLVNQLPGPWFDLGSGLAGSFGTPLLTGHGSCVAGKPASLTLTSAKPSSLALIFVSFVSNPAPFKGGTFLTFPYVFQLALFTNGSGAIPLSFNWPGSLPPGFSLDFQYAIADPGGPAGAALSNGVRAVQP